MQRTGRIIYNGAMVLSLLLCLGCAGVWVRSYWVEDSLQWTDWPADRSSFNSRGFCSSRGGVQLNSWHYKGPTNPFPEDEHFRYSSAHARVYPVNEDSFYKRLTPIQTPHRLPGYEWLLAAKGQYGGLKLAFVITSLTLPLYFPTLLFALLPAHYFLRVRRRRRIARRLARGCCPACGYDLRASAGRCPECGREGGGREMTNDEIRMTKQ